MTWPEFHNPPKGGWKLTTDHALSSYGIPVLISPVGDSYGPTDRLQIAQVAELTGYTSAHVRLMLRQGQIPEAIKIVSRWAIPARVALTLIRR